MVACFIIEARFLFLRSRAYLVYSTYTSIILSAFFQNLSSRNNANHISPIQTKNNDYQIFQICTHRHALLVFVLFRYDLICLKVL